MSDHFRVAIIGAGFGGLGLGIRLRQEKLDSFVILEKAGRIGGTWRDNTYPGAACDIQSHLYWFSFDEQPDWTRIYPLQAEILANIEAIAVRHDLSRHIRLNTEMVAARWDEAALFWRLDLQDGRSLTANTLVTAWGQLNRPSTQDIPGVEDFGGDWFHSARWRHEVALEGRRVASIGNGPSAAQFIPALAAAASQLSVFQRSPNYIIPRLDRAYDAEERETFRRASARAESRAAFYLEHENWFDAFHPDSPGSADFAAVARMHLEAQVADPVLRERLWPTYPLGCKRLIISDDFLPAVSLPHVTLVTERVERVERAGIRTADGVLHATDVIVYGTGFDTLQFLGTGDVTGRQGRSLREAWCMLPQAYLGMSVSGFPNLFMLYGPNTNLGHNSILLMLECQYEYVLQAIRAIDQKAAALDVRPESLAAFNVSLQAELRGTAWAGNCHSWYKTADNLITTNWSGTVEAYRTRTAKLDMADYEVLGALPDRISD